jgi:tetratricopeptide (TPR) repeat protein
MNLNFSRWGIRLYLALAVASTLTLHAADTKEEPVGLILNAANGKVLRSNTETELAARSGDILFSGDALRSTDSPANFLYCPAKASQSLDPAGQVLLDTKQIKVKTGKLEPPKPVNACFLPQLVRVAVASQQHYGVSMTRGLAQPEGDVIPFDQLSPDVRTQIAPFEAALKTNPDDASALVQEAAVFDREKLDANSLAAYRKIAALWKDATWVRGRIFELEESLATQAALKAAQVSVDAKTYALMIGISKYQKIPKEQWLQYADADAKTFAQYMSSMRAGGVPDNQMVVLTDEQATTAAIRNAFDTFLRQRAGKKDTIFILISAHGTVDNRGGFIMSYDSDPQSLSTTAIPLSEIQTLLDDELPKVGRVVFLADVSRTTAIGNLKTAAIGSAVEKLGEAQGELLGIMASRPRELSVEGTQFGGGHGAFTYSVLRAFQGFASTDDKTVTAAQLIDYTRNNTPSLTDNKQHPRDFGAMENLTKLADLTKPGIQLAHFRGLFDSRSGEPLLLAAAGPQQALPGNVQQDVNAFEAAVRAKRVLPGEPGSAFDVLPRLRAALPTEQLFLEENQLRVALEDQAQQVVLRYLAGDQNPQSKADFDSGARYMDAALQLTPESMYLQGRDSFFQGRGLLFDKQYSAAANLLETAVRIDPGEAYGYNALGIAYLEQADFVRAIPAFRDAARLAPNWAYPLHNLALCYVETGRTDEAIRSYQAAMKLTPQFSYLPYNLGLVYQRTNRRGEAEAAYRKAAALAPDSGMPLNALGSLKASEGKSAEAEKFYRDALAKDPALLPARHNLGILLAGLKGRQNEAIAAFRQNLAADPSFLPSQLSLAETLTATGDNAGAIAEYSKVVASKPEYTGARIALASLYLKTNQPDAAVEQLRAASKSDAQNATVWEMRGDAEKAANHPDEARQSYETAMKLRIEKGDRKRIRAKMNF